MAVKPVEVLWGLHVGKPLKSMNILRLTTFWDNYNQIRQSLHAPTPDGVCEVCMPENCANQLILSFNDVLSYSFRYSGADKSDYLVGAGKPTVVV